MSQPGWLTVAEVAKVRGTTRDAALKWLRRRDKSGIMLRHCGGNTPVLVNADALSSHDPRFSRQGRHVRVELLAIKSVTEENQRRLDAFMDDVMAAIGDLRRDVQTIRESLT